MESEETTDSITFKYGGYSATWQFIGDRILHTAVFDKVATRQPESDKLLLYRMGLVRDLVDPNIQLCPHEKSVDLSSDGLIIMQYNGLSVTDSDGQDIRFELINHDNTISWKIYDYDAVYPITVRGEMKLNLKNRIREPFECDSEYFDRPKEDDLTDQ